MDNIKDSNEEIKEIPEKIRKQMERYEKRFEPKNYKKIFIIICIVLLVLIILTTGFAIININNKNIIAGVTIDKITVQGLSKEDASEFLKKAVEEKLDKEININISGDQQTLLLSQLELVYDVDKAIEEAYNVGRNSNLFVNNFEIIKSIIAGTDIQLDFNYNDEILTNTVKDIKSKIPNVVVEPTYYIENENLIINRGKKGLTINENELKDKILQSANLQNSENVEINSFEDEPEDINIEKIYDEVYKEVQDAYYTTDPFTVYEEIEGVDFYLDEAKEILKEYKEEYIIPLIITKPNKTTKDIGTEAFPDLLGTFSTRYDESNLARTTNVKLAINKINDVLVMPGETFSYNQTLGERTYTAGYKDAAGYSGGKVVQMIGGGICQVSSTLYDAVVYANLEIVERHNHFFQTSYVGAGKDATVVYGSLDFKFKNTRNYPIKIKASAQNGIAKVDIYGIRESTEYKVEISTTILSYTPYDVVYENSSKLAKGTQEVTQQGMRGCKSITYKILTLNGKEMSRSVLSTDTYSPLDKCITRGTR